MVINWSNFAIQNLKDFLEISKIYDKVKYSNEMFNYIEKLIDNNYLGKYIITINKYDVRQLIFKKHKILYSVSNDEIRILALIHSSQDYTKMLKRILKNL